MFSHTRPVQAVAGYLHWYIGANEKTAKPFMLKSCHPHGKRMLAKLDGIDTIEMAEPLKGMKIFIEENEVELDDDEFLWEKLIGCTVVAQAGLVLGKVTALHEFGAQDNLEVHTLADAEVPGEWLIPFIESVVLDVDIENQRIEVWLEDGMDACFTPRS